MRIDFNFESIDTYSDKSGFAVVSANRTAKGGAALNALRAQSESIAAIDWKSVPIAARAASTSRWWRTPDQSLGESRWQDKHESTMPLSLQVSKIEGSRPFSHLMRVNMIPREMWPAAQLQSALHQNYRMIFGCIQATEQSQGWRFTSIAMTMLGGRQDYSPKQLGTELIKATNGLSVLWPLRVYCVLPHEPDEASSQHHELRKAITWTLQATNFENAKGLLEIAIGACTRHVGSNSAIGILRDLLNDIHQGATEIPYQTLATAARQIVLDFLLLLPEAPPKIKEWVGSPQRTDSHTGLTELIDRTKRDDFQGSCLWHILQMAFDCEQHLPEVDRAHPKENAMMESNVTALIAMIPALLEATTSHRGAAQ